MTSLAESTVVGHLDAEQQARMVAVVREVLRSSPLVRPKTPNGLDMRVRVSAAGRLGWVGDGAYRYSTTDSLGYPWPRMPDEWRSLADAALPEGEAPPAWDSAIINWYEPGASLGWHRDQSEADLDLAIVTFSLGDACGWAVKLHEDDRPSRTFLESGAVTLLAGRTRSALHTVSRIIPAPMFSPLAKRGRVSVTMRQAGVSP